jgi:hypothetical protein
VKNALKPTPKDSTDVGKGVNNPVKRVIQPDREFVVGAIGPEIHGGFGTQKRQRWLS